MANPINPVQEDRTPIGGPGQGKYWAEYEGVYTRPWLINDPDGDVITNVPSRSEAETLLSHLNRE